jgi:hypothetical protein
MYQSSTRNNFLDILPDPTVIAILVSIALHATIGASLPFFTQPDKEGKKVSPSTVKVLELTPIELQRIPQSPPTPTSQVLPPVTQPIPASRPAVAPVRTPQFSTAPQTIPFSPIRTPFNGVTIKPSQSKKQQKAIPKKQPIAPIFDPANIFKPAKKPSKPPIQKGIKPKPLVQKSPPLKPQPIARKPKPPAAPAPRKNTPTDDDGGDRFPPTPATTPTRQVQQPAATPRPTVAATPKPATQPATQPSSNPTSSNESTIYGKSTQVANAKLQEYLKRYPNLKPYQPKSLLQSYPPGIPCPKVKQPPFIVLVAFDKVPEGQGTNILGSGISPLLNDEKPYINGDSAMLANKKLLDLANTAGFADATEADKKRPVADKGKPVLYQYRVQFDRATCKN